jgi:hypothetical protein
MAGARRKDRTHIVLQGARGAGVASATMPLFTRADSFSLYGRQRSRRRVPRWLLLLLAGLVAGAAGVIYAQQRLLPPRLSAEASTRLTSTLERTEAERQRLAAELALARQQLEGAVAQRRALGQQVEVLRAGTERLHASLAEVVEALPPDPRQGQVAVRSARFAVASGMLDYSVVLTRQARSGTPLPGQLQLVVTGASAQRAAMSVELKPIALTLGAHEVVHGQMALPAGFQPEQTTVRVLDAKAGTLLGSRVLWVR